jgi:hypothetical protein
MHWYRYLVILLVVPTFALPARAGLFSKRAKANPAQRVPELLTIVKTEQDDRKRAAAVDELRQYDVKAFPEIIPVLIDVLRGDGATSVRMEALHTLGRFRPVSQPVGEALEQAAANDKSWRLRLQARTTLVSYRWSGYRTAKAADAPAPRAMNSPTTDEPPLALIPAPGAAPRVAAPSPPPRAPAAPSPMPARVTSVAQPLPMGTAEPPLLTTPPPPQTPPSGPDQGPVLDPPS